MIEIVVFHFCSDNFLLFHFSINLLYSSLIRNIVTMSTFGKKTQDRREKRLSDLFLLLSHKINIDPPGRHIFGSLKHTGQLEATTLLRSS